MDKQAYEHMVGLIMDKSASSYTDALGDMFTLTNPFVSVVSPAGKIIGYSEEPTGRKELKYLNNPDIKNHMRSLIPGVGSARLAKRLVNTHKAYGSESPAAKAIHQEVGPATQILLSALIGAGIGGVAGGALGDDIGVGTAAGIAGGAGIGMASGAAIGVGSQLIGSLAAALTRTRTAEEQRKASNQGSVRNHLIPGYGMYDYLKTLGHSNYVS